MHTSPWAFLLHQWGENANSAPKINMKFAEHISAPSWIYCYFSDPSWLYQLRNPQDKPNMFSLTPDKALRIEKVRMLSAHCNTYCMDCGV